MTDNVSKVLAFRAQLVNWLCGVALPLWERHGVDLVNGGYFETLAFDHAEGVFRCAGPVRRGRVVARQMYVFDVGRRLGRENVDSDPVNHGCAYLFERLLRRDGLFHTAISSETNLPAGDFSLYEHAFYLFALARTDNVLSHRYPIKATASRCLEQMVRTLRKTNGGFNEGVPPSVPLKSNPHMHMLEACLAWIEAIDDTECGPWVTLGSELVDLSLERFFDEGVGVIREYFDEQWQPLPDDRGRLVEPGHQFEWGWLLMQWADLPCCNSRQRAECMRVAKRLVHAGERWGVDQSRGVAFNEIWDDLSAKDRSAKIWPQTERVKAWCAMAQAASGQSDFDLACENLLLALQGLRKFLEVDPAGLWQEVMLPDGGFTSEPSKASSLYHIVCAIETLHALTARCFRFLPSVDIATDGGLIAT